MHVLVVEAERHLAGRQHAQGAARRRAAPRTSAGRLRRRRARSCRAPARSSAPESRSASAPAPPGTCSVSATTLGEVAPDAVDGVEPDQPDAARARVSRAPTSIASRVLPTPAGPTTVTSRCCAAGRRGHRREVVGRGRRSGRPRGGRLPGAPRRGGRPARGPGSAASTCCSRDLQARRPGSMPSSSTSIAPYPCVRRERVGLPPGAVERGDQRRPEPLAQRVLVDQRLELADDVAAGAEVDPRRHARPRRSPSRTSSSRVRWAAAQSPASGQHLAAEQRQRPRAACVQRGGGVAGTAASAAAAPRGRRPGSASTAAGVDGQRVAVVRRRSTSSRSPSARRSCETFDCRVLRPAGPAHRSSMSASARTCARRRAPAATSSSVVLPAGRSSRTPSRRTSTGPSTPTVSTRLTLGACDRVTVTAGGDPGHGTSASARRQRAVSAPGRRSSHEHR